MRLLYSTKFSRIAIYEDFTLQYHYMHCRTVVHILWAWHTSMVYLTRIVTLSSAWVCSCEKSIAYFKCISLETVTCRLSTLSPGMSIYALAVREWKLCVASKIFAEIFSQKFAKFVKLKTHKKYYIQLTSLVTTSCRCSHRFESTSLNGRPVTLLLRCSTMERCSTCRLDSLR